MIAGKVYLVGAGPGDPSLLTLKGRRALETADTVFHDRLVDSRTLQMAGARAEIVDVGKLPGELGRSQESIERLMIERAQRGERVVRLKGGDPFVFGRGGEEAAALAAAGIPFEIVPGVSSAIAAPAYAGIPLTHREYASSFTVTTASVAADAPSRDHEWRALAQTPGTLVVLMGWNRLADVADALIANGKPASTPAAVVSSGTSAVQKTVTDRLDSIAKTAVAAGLSSPAAVVIGDVVRLRDRLGWFEKLPLFGRRVLVTRAEEQAGTLARRLAELGAYPLEIPTVAIRYPVNNVELDAALQSVTGFDWIVFTSANAVGAVWRRLRAIGRDARCLYGVSVASIGAATTRRLGEIGIVPDLTPAQATASALASTLCARGVDGSSILLPRSDIAAPDLPAALLSRGANVHEVMAYRTVTPTSSVEKIVSALESGVDIVTFTSSSTVVNSIDMLGEDAHLLQNATVACIGPVSAATAGRYGLNVDIVAEIHNVDGLVEKLSEWFGGRVMQERRRE